MSGMETHPPFQQLLRLCSRLQDLVRSSPIEWVYSKQNLWRQRHDQEYCFSGYMQSLNILNDQANLHNHTAIGMPCSADREGHLTPFSFWYSLMGGSFMYFHQVRGILSAKIHSTVRCLNTKSEFNTNINVTGHLDNLGELHRFLGGGLEVVNGEDLES